MDINVKIQEILLTWSEKQIANAKQILQGDGKVAKGVLINSLIATLAADKSIIISFAGYGQAVSDGRSPGRFPPIDELKDWCAIKGIPEEAAYPIARSIAKNGTRGDNWIDTIMESVDELTQLLSDAVADNICLEVKQNIESSQKA